MKNLLLIVAALLTAHGPAWADTLKLGSTADTSISARDPNNNSGAHTHVSSGRDGNLGGHPRRALFRFDLSAIPAGSTINAVSLKLQVVKSPIGAANSNFQLRRMTAGWLEGTGFGNNGAPAALGDATWNNRAHGFTPWSGGVGGSGDFSATVSATTPVTGQASYTWSDSRLVTDAEGWLNNPGSNFGWILISDGEANNKTARGFGSRESGTAAHQPELTIDYTPPAPPTEIIIESFTPGSNSLELVWTGSTGLLYCVEYSNDLMDSNGWKTAEAFIGSAGVSNIWNNPPLPADPVYEGNSNLFFRIQGLETNIQPLEVQLDPVASGLTAPLLVTHAGDGSGRLFIVEQVGRIRIVEGGTLLPTPFLDIGTNLVPINAGYDERGLLGLAFHPDYANNGRFFVHYSAPPNGDENNLTTIAEYQVSAGSSNVADAAGGQIILQEPQPEGNHAGGTLAFGPDGYLYLAIGDGGGANDAHGAIGNGQNVSNLLGSMIRIDIDAGSPYAIPPGNPFHGSTTAREEIFAYGLRNPYRFSFDRGGTNALFCGDVGQGLWEEINIIERGGNYGWRIAEGNFAFDLPLAGTLGVDLGNLKYPIHNYPHGPLGTTVIGGFVYRGITYPELIGNYIFGDFSTGFGAPDGQLYYLSETLPGKWQRFEFSIQPGGGPLGRYVKGFGEDEDGEIYLLSDTTFAPGGTGGEVHRLVKP